MSEKKRGAFIVFEGLDGSGKSTQHHILATRLAEEKIRFVSEAEPTKEPVGALLRRYLKGELSCDLRTVALLFAADRLEHVSGQNGMLGMVKRGTNVLCDRYYMSSCAYHSVELDMEWVISINRESSNLLRPDITFFIDTPPDICCRRIEERKGKAEIFENKKRLIAVRENYIRAIDRLGDDVVVINGEKDKNEIAGEIYSHITKLIGD